MLRKSLETQLHDLKTKLDHEHALRTTAEKAKHQAEMDLNTTKRLLEQTEIEFQHTKFMLDQSKGVLTAKQAVELEVEELKRKVKAKKAKITKLKKKCKDISGIFIACESYLLDQKEASEQNQKNAVNSLGAVTQERDKLIEELKQTKSALEKLQHDSKSATDIQNLHVSFLHDRYLAGGEAEACNRSVPIEEVHRRFEC